MKSFKKAFAAAVLCAAILTGGALTVFAAPDGTVENSPGANPETYSLYDFGGDDWGWGDDWDDGWDNGSSGSYGDINDAAAAENGGVVSPGWGDNDGDWDNGWAPIDDFNGDSGYPDGWQGAYPDDGDLSSGRSGSGGSLFLSGGIGALAALLMTVIVNARYRNAGAGTVYNLTANTSLDLGVRRDELIDRKVSVERNYYAPRGGPAPR